MSAACSAAPLHMWMLLCCDEQRPICLLLPAPNFYETSSCQRGTHSSACTHPCEAQRPAIVCWSCRAELLVSHAVCTGYAYPCL